MGDQWADLPLKGSEALPAGSPRPGPTVQIGGKETALAVVDAGNSIASAARSFAAMDYNVTLQNAPVATPILSAKPCLRQMCTSMST